jgi:hypothetical protein
MIKYQIEGLAESADIVGSGGTLDHEAHCARVKIGLFTIDVL